MLILRPTRKSRIEKAPCCAGCKQGKPCSGKPAYEQRNGLWLPERELLTPRRKFAPLNLLGHPSPLEWPGGRFWPGLPMRSVTFDMSCTGCCANCCGFTDETRPSPLTVTFSTSAPACACFNYAVIDMAWDGSQWISSSYNDPCSPDTTLVNLNCDSGTDSWEFTKLTSAECSIQVILTLITCRPLRLTGTEIIGPPDNTNCTDCPDGTQITIDITE